VLNRSDECPLAPGRYGARSGPTVVNPIFGDWVFDPKNLPLNAFRARPPVRSIVQE
jgi:hypothetical protein